MQIIKRGRVEASPFQIPRLINEEGVIARLYGDWVHKYAGQELAIIVLDGQTDASAVWWFETMAKILNGVEDEHEVALSDPLHDQELDEREKR